MGTKRQIVTNKKILVTGGAGFIGSHLCDYLLKAGAHVVCLDNFDPFYNRAIKMNNLHNALAHPSFTLLEADIRDDKSIKNCFRTNKFDMVVHLAARAGVRPSIEDPLGYYDVNVRGTLNLLEAMKETGVNQLIFASSSSVYGNNEKVPFSECDPVDNPISPYAATKKAGELICHTYHYLHHFNIYCLRFFTVYGPRQRPDLAIHKFTNCILNKQPIDVYGDGSSSRDYTYISDIIDGIIGALKNLKGFEIINLGESRTISLIRMINTIENKLGMIGVRNNLPMQPGDVITTYADITKARKLIDYSPSYEFEEGIREFIRWKVT